MKPRQLHEACTELGVSPAEFMNTQREKRRPSYEDVKRHIERWPTEAEVIEASTRHLSDEERESLVKLASQPLKKMRKSRS